MGTTVCLLIWPPVTAGHKPWTDLQPSPCPSILESQVSQCNTTACKHTQTQPPFLGNHSGSTRDLCARDPQPFQSLWVGSFGTTAAQFQLTPPIPLAAHGWSARSGHQELVAAFLSSHGCSPEAFPRPDAWICAPGPCCCTQGGGSPGPAAECGADKRARSPGRPHRYGALSLQFFKQLCDYQQLPHWVGYFHSCPSLVWGTRWLIREMKRVSLYPHCCLSRGKNCRNVTSQISPQSKINLKAVQWKYIFSEAVIHLQLLG